MPQDKYELVFTGYRYAQEHLIDHFEVKADIAEQDYIDYKNANKSFFLGAQRQNLTGSVLLPADMKALLFSAWDLSLSDEDLKLRSKNPLITGNSYSHTLER